MQLAAEMSRTKGPNFDVIAAAGSIYEFLAGHDKQPGRPETIAAASYDNAPQASAPPAGVDYHGLRLEFPTKVMIDTAADVLLVRAGSLTQLRARQIAEHMLREAFDAVRGFDATRTS